jgi:hypothetical protein
VASKRCGKSRLTSARRPTEVSPMASPASQRRALARGEATTASAKIVRKSSTRSNSLKAFSGLAAHSAERPVQIAKDASSAPETSAERGIRAAGQKPTAEARTRPQRTITAIEFRLVRP